MHFAGFQALVGGVDSGRHSALLSPESISWAVNATMRGGFLTCRPGWFKHAIKFYDADGLHDAALASKFQDGLWQGGLAYIGDDGTVQLVCSVSGWIFSIKLSTLIATLLNASDQNHPTLPKAWFTQAERWLIIQNASDQAFIFDGQGIRRSKGLAEGEVPAGGPMGYANGRLWVALLEPGGEPGAFYKFTAGDLAYSDGTRAAILKFTERSYLNGGGDFIVPVNGGPIRAMVPVAVQDSSTGQGPLQIFTTRCCFSVNAPFAREEWANLTSPIQTVSMLAAGALSDSSTINVNGDIWFRSFDGVRSFVIARRDHGTWVNTPLSQEVSRVLDYDAQHLLEHGSAALFDNRLFVTCAPQTVTQSGVHRGTVHNGLAVLDFAPVSTMMTRSQPQWEGLWTGLRIFQVVPVDIEPRRLIIIALDIDDDISLWEMSVRDRDDNGNTSAPVPIQWFFESPSYGFTAGGWNLLQLHTGDLWFNRIGGDITWTARFRPDNDPVWVAWATGTVCATVTDCPPSCPPAAPMVEQYRVRQQLPMPADTIDPTTNKPYRHGYRFALRVDIIGGCQIPQARLMALDVPEPRDGAAPPSACTATAKRIDCAVANDFAYSTEGGVIFLVDDQGNYIGDGSFSLVL